MRWQNGKNKRFCRNDICREVMNAMKDKILQELANRNSFKLSDFTEVCHNNGCTLGDSALRKRLQDLLKSGEIVRVGHGSYSVKRENHSYYFYRYSELTEKIVEQVHEAHPYLNFTVFELVQLNEFVNHQIAHNAIFVSVENEVASFVFDTLRELYPGKVLLYPSVETYHQYWSDDMIVITRLITEAPIGFEKPWHTGVEKLLVDIITEPVIANTVSAGEYPTVYEDAFKKYVINETQLFRYAKRRSASGRIKKMIKEQTTIELKTKE